MTGGWVSCLVYTAFTHITLSSVETSIPFRECYFFRALQIQTFLQLFNVIYAHKNAVFLKKNLHDFEAILCFL